MATTTSEAFGPLLRRYRLAAGLTQEALAERAGMSARGVQDLERGIRRAPRLETVRLLADALGLSGEAVAGLITAARPELASPPAAEDAISLRPAPAPVPPTALVGRDAEITAVCALLRSPRNEAAPRLVTLTGAGGVGKTRLALAVAAELAGDYADGVAWVELAPLRDPELVGTTIAHALGLRETGQRSLSEGLALALADRHTLLVLDNCEHLLAAAPLLGQLLAACPRLAILATSRARLRLRGERELPLEPLAVPAASFTTSLPLATIEAVPAVRLFVARAAEVRPEFTLTVEHAPAVAGICRRLEGLPLALELAAARIKLLPPPALLARLEQRLSLLASGPRDLPLRQQTMRDTIAWSHDLLNAQEQALFQRLAVFAGGFTLDAVECVTERLDARAAGGTDPLSPPLELLISLCDQSLLRSLSAEGGEPRFALLETVREYAWERLTAVGEEASLRDAHAAYFLALAERAEPELTGPDQTIWLDRLEVEHDNLRAALEWASAREIPTAVGVRLAGALWRFWWRRGHYREGRSWLERVLVRDGGTQAERAKALYGAGSLATEQGDYGQATGLLEDALTEARAAGDGATAALALTDLGNIARQHGAYERVTHYHEEALALRRESGDRRGIAVSQGNLGLALLYQGAYQQAEELLTEAATAFRELGDRHSHITTTSNLALAAVMQGDFARAQTLAETSLAGYRSLRDRQGIADDLLTLGLATQGQGNLEQASPLFAEALTHAREIDYKIGEAAALHRLGLVALETGDAPRALLLLGDSLRIVAATGDVDEMAGILEAIARVVAKTSPAQAARFSGMTAEWRETRGIVRPLAEQAAHDGMVAAVRHALGEEAFTAAFAAGRSLPLPDAIDEALASDSV